MEKFESLFPLKGLVTQEILEIGDSGHPMWTSGALALRQALGENVKYLLHQVCFGMYTGTNEVWKDEEQKRVNVYKITTAENINFDNVKSPIEVTFILKSPELQGKKYRPIIKKTSQLEGRRGFTQTWKRRNKKVEL